MSQQITPNQIKDEVKKHAGISENSNGTNRTISHNKVLSKLLKKVDKVDFHLEVDTDNNLKKKHYVVITVEKILELAKQHNWGLCKRHDFIYLYNGAFWSQLEEEELQTFLGKAALKMGVDKFDSKYHRFREELVKQFMALAHLPAPDVESDLVLINLLNGTVEINPLQDNPVSIREPDQRDFITYQLPFEYDPKSTAPIFMNYLDRVLPDKDMQNIIAEYLGYVFVRVSVLKLEKALLLYGEGANGKSVFFDTINALFSKNNVSNFTLKSLTEANGYHRAKLDNMLVNYSSEIDGKMDTALFKQLVSGEPVEARLPYGEPFTVTDYAKLIFNSNELPADVEHTNAYFRRFLIIPFDVTIPDEEQDKELSNKIIEKELSGVFNWVLKGLERLLDQKGFTKSKMIENQLSDFRRESDSVLSFMHEYNYSKSFDEYVPLSEIYEKYRRFCKTDGYHPCGKRKFNKRIKSAGYTVQRKEYGNVVYVVQNK